MRKISTILNKLRADRQFDEAHGNYDTQDHTWDDCYPEGDAVAIPDYDTSAQATYPTGRHGEHPFSNHF